MNVNLIVNPIAGNKALRSIKNIEDLLNKKASLTTFITQKKGDAELFARQITSEFRGDNPPLPPFTKGGQGGDLVIIAGGDGTFNEVINGMLSSKESAAKKKIVPLAFIPLGTTNVLAKELNIPEDVGKAVHLALTGAAKKISLGRINGRYFALMAGIGFDGETVLRVKDSIKKISGKEAYIFSGIKALIKYNPSLIEIKTSEGTFTGYTAVAGKARCYGGNFHVTPQASLTEPLLDLCLFKGKTRKDLVRFIIGVIRGRHLNFNDVFYGKFSE
ncbi:MAG: diacylglycerol kinase family protein, partial [Nitrospirota bacterium]